MCKHMSKIFCSSLSDERTGKFLKSGSKEKSNLYGVKKCWMNLQMEAELDFST